ncbi:hypothetical protein FB567DRAFT_612162 [Paraphoma chrysanthemicola]|uniref:Major facilitator superfamily (MFS) profile domain-containing protein n=1 Tax=Paraphoma chrysanthemicola TaxID=798071 RepID=A0A8K0VTS9_9PLEO|nr:hypothetical protein FB567DRAFT_612162 [Paraphoma chrysanthemicola]
MLFSTASGSKQSVLKKFQQNFNGRLAYAVGFIALSQVNFGLEQSVFNNTQAMTNFTRRFGVNNTKTRRYQLETYYLSLLGSLTYIGFVFGLVTGNFLSAKIGRKKCFAVMCFWAILGTIVCITTETNKWQMVAGRMIAYVYIGMELALVPVTQSELVPAAVRGAVVGTYQSSLLFGSLIGSVICRGTGDLAGAMSWRVPMGMLFVIPSVMLCSVWYIPESPRWLLMKNRPEDAMENLRLLRQGRFTDEQIQQEFREFQSTLNATVKKGTFSEMFQGTNLRRTLIVIGVNVFLQITGQNFVSVYGSVFIKSLGVVNPFTMASINSALGIVFVLITQAVTNKTGRVPLMTAGALIQTAALFTMGALGTRSNPTQPVKAGSVFNIAIQFTVSFSIPYLLNEPYAGLGSKVGFIFGSTATLAMLFSWFCIPECGGKTLEEIDELFLKAISIKQFGKNTGLSRRAHLLFAPSNFDLG